MSTEIPHHYRGRNYNHVLSDTVSRSSAVSAFNEFWGTYLSHVDTYIRDAEEHWRTVKPQLFADITSEFSANLLPEVRELLFEMFAQDLRQNRCVDSTEPGADSVSTPGSVELVAAKWKALASDYAWIDVERFIERQMW